MPSCGLVLIEPLPSLAVPPVLVEHRPGGGKNASSGISSATKTGWGKCDIVRTVERSLIVLAGYEGGRVEGGTGGPRTRWCGTAPRMVNPVKYPSAPYTRACVPWPIDGPTPPHVIRAVGPTPYSYYACVKALEPTHCTNSYRLVYSFPAFHHSYLVSSSFIIVSGRSHVQLYTALHSSTHLISPIILP